VNADEKIEVVAKFIVEQGDDVDGLTAQKIYKRGCLVDNPAHPDSITLDVVRHKAALGCTYRPGFGMPAFIEYTQRIVFDPQTRQISIESGEYSGGCSLQIDYALFGDDQTEAQSFTIEVRPDGSFVCHETSGKDRCVVSDESDVKEFAHGLVREWALELYEAELKEYFPPDQVKDHLVKIQDILETRLAEKAVTAWRDFLQERRKP
jgi:hypothetical protein